MRQQLITHGLDLEIILSEAIGEAGFKSYLDNACAEKQWYLTCHPTGGHPSSTVKMYMRFSGAALTNKPTQIIAPYITKGHPLSTLFPHRGYATALLRLRTGCSTIQLHTDFTQKDPALRHCKHCVPAVAGTVPHALFHCKRTQHSRYRLLQQINDTGFAPQWNSLNMDQLIALLLLETVPSAFDIADPASTFQKIIVQWITGVLDELRNP